MLNSPKGILFTKCRGELETKPWAWRMEYNLVILIAFGCRYYVPSTPLHQILLPFWFFNISPLKLCEYLHCGRHLAHILPVTISQSRHLAFWGQGPGLVYMSMSKGYYSHGQLLKGWIRQISEGWIVAQDSQGPGTTESHRAWESSEWETTRETSYDFNPQFHFDFPKWCNRTIGLDWKSGSGLAFCF